jgi:hypothetical protein
VAAQREKKGGRGFGPRELLDRRGCWAAGWKRKKGGREERGGVYEFSFFSNLFKLIFQTFEIELFFKL